MRIIFNLLCLYSFLILGIYSCTKDKKPVIGATNRVDIRTLAIRNIGADSAISGGEITRDGGDPVSERGVCWSTSTNPTVNQNRTNNGSGTGTYSSTFKNLTPNTIYYVRAYLINAQGTIYGNQVSFRSAAGIPKIETTPATSITASSLNTGGRNISDGGASISQKGICFSSTNQNPTIANSVIPSGSGTSNFSVSISNLVPNTNYYIRAYATNSAGSGYGNTIQIRTLAIQLPTLTTTSISSVTQTTANSGGNITNAGGGSITQRGICWSTSPNPTISNSRTVNGSGIGSFSSQMTGLQPNTTYYVRAYATNAAGTGYGQQYVLTTFAVQLATLTTSSVSSITQTTALSGGNISNDGGGSVSQRGICWNTTGSPTISNSRTNNGSGTGSFSSQMTGLQANITYYVRAYATNAAGTAYGSQISFRTLSYQLPTVTTSGISSIGRNSATGGGNVTNDGGYTVTERGICWSTSTNPTISNSRTINGSGIGAFTSSISSLQPGTTYYVRAYARNALGPGYGAQISFRTNN